MAKKEYIERWALIADYDRVHKGEAGGARKLMVDAPTADVVEVRHGEWSYYYDDGVKRCKCSECITSYGCMDTPYCPNCGAKMDGKGECE